MALKKIYVEEDTKKLLFQAGKMGDHMNDVVKRLLKRPFHPETHQQVVASMIELAQVCESLGNPPQLKTCLEKLTSLLENTENV